MLQQNKICLSDKIRIIGGHWRGQKLKVPCNFNLRLRPTSSRIRETLFNWLQPIIHESCCLDCFAGSGALGIEALSRGAASVTLLEQDRLISAFLIKNLQRLKIEKAKVITTNTFRWLNNPKGTFDVVFVDPPFRRNMVNKIVDLLEINYYLTPNAWIYIETEAKCAPPLVPRYWNLHKEEVNGQVAFRLYIRRKY